jgi:hypothetical protein
MYAEASKAAVRISSPELASQVNTLLAVNAYEQDDLPGGAAAEAGAFMAAAARIQQFQAAALNCGGPCSHPVYFSQSSMSWCCSVCSSTTHIPVVAICAGAYMAGCRRQLERCAGTAGCEVEVAINTGCMMFKEGDYAGAAAKFNEAAAIEGSQVRELNKAC